MKYTTSPRSLDHVCWFLLKFTFLAKRSWSCVNPIQVSCIDGSSEQDKLKHSGQCHPEYEGERCQTRECYWVSGSSYNAIRGGEGKAWTIIPSKTCSTNFPFCRSIWEFKLDWNAFFVFAVQDFLDQYHSGRSVHLYSHNIKGHVTKKT